MRRPVPVYFLQRPLHRARQRDTVAHLPDPYVAVMPPSPREAIADHAVNRRRARSLRGRIAGAAARTPVALNAGLVTDPAARRCRLLYTWGKLPLWPRRPRFVVELDNPYVLTLYHNVRAQRRLRPVLRRALLGRRCAGIVCISEACRRTLAATLGADVAARARVVYPFVEAGPAARPGGRVGRLEVLFVGTQPWVKGLRELCAAFATVAADVGPARLTVVTRVPTELRDAHQGDSIRFVEADLPRERVARELMPAADLLALPTMQESFGMAALEAVAAGLPVLATDVYAMREIVEDGRNGVLLPDPLGLWDGDVADPVLWAEPDLGARLRARSFPAHEAAIAEALRRMLGDRALLARMGEQSASRYRERFAPGPRAARMRAALDAFTDA